MKMFFPDTWERQLSPDSYGTIAVLLILVTPVAVWWIYRTATEGVLHGGYLWGIFTYGYVLWRCMVLGWRGDSARRSGFAEEPRTLDDFSGMA